MNSSSPKPPTERQRKRHERILQTTRDLLAESGYDGINMRELAKAAGVATNTLYNLYESKDNLILKAGEEFLDTLEESVNFEADTALECFIGLHTIFADGIARSPNYSQTMIKIYLNAELESALVRQMMTAVIDMEKRLLLRLVEERVLEGDTNLFLAARRLMGATWSCVVLWSKGYIALNDFERTYLREHLYLLIPLAADQKAIEELKAALRQA